jgi:hypothetical protein
MMVVDMTAAYNRRQSEDGEAVAACNEAISILQGYPGMEVGGSGAFVQLKA